MFRDDSPIKPPRKDVNCVLMNGGVGDHVGGSLIAIDYIIKTYPWINLLVWAPDFLVEFAKNVLPKGCVIRGYSDMPKKYDAERTTINTMWDGRFSPMKIHQTDYAFHVLCDEKVDYDKKNYLSVNTAKCDLTRFALHSRYAVVATGYTAAVREFSPSSINQVSDYLVGRGITPVFLGSSKAPTGFSHTIQTTFKTSVEYDKGLNLLDKTSLVEAAAIIAKAEVMIGVDCGLMHVAGCTDTTIVGGYTTVKPELRAPIRHNLLGWNWYPVVPDESLGCKFCQVNTNFLYGHDYKECLYKDNKCVAQLTAEKFIAQLERILK